MAEYIVCKPVDMKNLTAKARKSLPALFDITPKFDGCCAVLTFTAAGYTGAYSATGEPAPSMDIIGREIELSGALRGQQIALVGEAWMPGADFPTINGAFRRKREQPQLKFAPFDAVEYDFEGLFNIPVLADDRPYIERAELLMKLPYGDGLVKVPHTIGGLEGVETLAASYKDLGGYDGTIVRDPYAPYVVGRSKAEVIKVKPVLSLDLLCTNVMVGAGEKTGRGVLTLEVEYRGVRSVVGSGVPHTFQPATYHGQIIEVECMGLTPDGKLREPRFKGIRYDKTGPDA